MTTTEITERKRSETELHGAKERLEYVVSHNHAVITESRTAESDVRIVAVLMSLSEIMSVVLILIGFLVLVGWTFDITILKSLSPNLVTMKANTAICFVLSGVSLWLLQAKRMNSAYSLRTAQISGLIVAAVGVLTLVEYGFGFNLGIDQLVFRESPGAVLTSNLGRMAPTTAFNFFIVGVALLLLGKQHYLSFQLIVLIEGVVAFLAVLGYMYGVTGLYKIPWGTSMAIHTAVMFLLITGSVLFARPDEGIMRVVTSNLLGGAIVRRILPVALTMVVTGGWVSLQGERAGYYGTEYAVALLVIFGTTMLTAITWMNARSLNSAEQVRVQSEKKMLMMREETRFRNTLDSMMEGCQIIGFDWRYIYVNDAAAKHGRRAKEELLGHTMMEMYPGIENTEMFRVLRKCMESRTSQHMENEFAFPDGYKGWFELAVSPVREGIFILSEDITERRLIAQEVADVTERKRLMDMREQFLSAITHELRTPLSPLKVHLHYALAGKLGPISQKLESSLQVMKRSVERLHKLTNELLDLRRIQAGRLQLNPEPMNFREILDQSIKEIQVIADQRKQRVHLQVPDGPLPVRGDPARLGQVLANLLDNASKYTPEQGDVTIYVDADADAIRLDISDTGVGIRKEDLPKVFEPFSNIKKSRSIQTMGLGLSIAKGIVEAHGGKMWVESDGEGKGAAFTFTLPKLKEES